MSYKSIEREDWISERDKELDEMFLGYEIEKTEEEINAASKSVETISKIDNTYSKVYMKTNDTKTHSYDGGYGSVLGVVLVIISISFILAALFIRMLI